MQPSRLRFCNPCRHQARFRNETNPCWDWSGLWIYGMMPSEFVPFSPGKVQAMFNLNCIGYRLALKRSSQGFSE